MRAVRRLRTSAALSIIAATGAEEAVGAIAGAGLGPGTRELPPSLSLSYCVRANRLQIDVRYSGLERIWSAIDRVGAREDIARFERG